MDAETLEKFIPYRWEIAQESEYPMQAWFSVCDYLRGLTAALIWTDQYDEVKEDVEFLTKIALRRAVMDVDSNLRVLRGAA